MTLKTWLRYLVISVTVATVASTGHTQSRRGTVNFDFVDEIARNLADKPFEQNEVVMPEKLRTMGYDAYRGINFDSQKALWRNDGTAFQAQFFHPGFLFTHPVRLFEYTDTHLQEIPFLSSFFNYYHEDISQNLPRELGFAGFRIHAPINNVDVYDEVIAFLGASYFRAVSSNLNYGLSARGISVDTGGSEEFPPFTQFWLKKPVVDDSTLTILALLEGQTVTGAYEFIIEPGLETVVTVRTRIYSRSDFKTIGLAPLTSMFWFGENTRYKPDDWRPQVHDSDGLLIHENKDELLWRPLTNVRRSHIQSFPIDRLRGFGLMQRDRNFENYQDLEAKYENRPSAWVEPIGNWGPGKVHLLELATNNEMMDNIVAFWRPDSLPEKGEPLDLRYKIIWGRDPAPQSIAKVEATRSGPAINHKEATTFVIDFTTTHRWPQMLDDKTLIPSLAITGGEVINGPILMRNPINNTIRMFFDAVPARGVDAVHLRAHLKINASMISEIWTYRWEQ